MSASGLVALAAECRRYAGPALAPLLAPARRGRWARVALEEALAEAAAQAGAAGDREGVRLVRHLLRLPPRHRRALRNALTAAKLGP